MQIYITSGVGIGKTTLSAFDSALKNAGVNNFNLIYISSIIPEACKISVAKYKAQEEHYGDRLYIVKAEIRSRESEKFIGAALGWYQLPDGKGVFVEHTAIGETEEAIKSNLNLEVQNSLFDLCKVRRFPLNKKRFKSKMSIVKVGEHAASTLVLAVYKSEKW